MGLGVVRVTGKTMTSENLGHEAIFLSDLTANELKGCLFLVSIISEECHPRWEVISGNEISARFCQECGRIVFLLFQVTAI